MFVAALLCLAALAQGKSLPASLKPAATAPPSPAVRPLGQPGPRLLLVDIDDVGFDLLRATPTPVFDWLERNGRFFTNFTTSPLCSPTRAMVMAGVYPCHPDILLGWIINGMETYSMPLSPLEALPSVVRAGGFTTAKVGKWHLAPLADPTHVLRAGWEHHRGSLSNLRSSGSPHGYSDFRKWVDGVETQLTGVYATTDESNDAIDYLRAGVDFVSLSYHAPHLPIHVPPPTLHSISPVDSDYDRVRAMLAACDTEFGRVLRTAIALDYDVLVFSDNGTIRQIGGHKGTLFEGGIVNPMWAYGPRITPGIDSTRIGALDIYDTVLDLFGLERDSATRGPQSQSFRRSLRGRTQHRRWSYSERYELLGVDPRTGAATWPRTLRTDRFKLMRDQTMLGDRLYDLMADPGESTNLLSSGPLSPAAQNAFDQLRVIFDTL